MAEHFELRAAECIEEYDSEAFYDTLWDIKLPTNTSGQPAHPEKTGVCLAAAFYWLYECIRLRQVKNNWKDMTGTYVCELRKIYDLQHDYETEWKKSASITSFAAEVSLTEGLWGLTYPQMRLQVQPLIEEAAMNMLKQQSYFADNIMPVNSGMLMAITPAKKISNGHAVAFYKNTEGEIYFFDVETGCYKLYNLNEFLAGDKSYIYSLVGLRV